MSTRMPNTTAEWLRVVHAIRAGAPASTVYLVVSTGSELLRVQALTATLGDAEALLGHDVPPALGWTTKEMNSREIWGPITCDDASSDIFDPLPHVCWTESPQIAASMPRADHVKLKDVSNMRLVYNVGSTEKTFPLPAMTDAVFLTEAAREAYMYPQYDAFFGSSYVAALRSRIEG